jgi:hypothetical protein
VEISLLKDRDGRLICTIGPDDCPVLVTAADATLAGMELLDALDDVGEAGYGECVWREAGGDYRWMFRRRGTQLTVVALWSGGTLTGWEHVLQVDTEFEAFVRKMRAELSAR